MRVLPLLGVLLLAACAAPQPVWVKPGASSLELDQARRGCEYDAAMATQQTDSTLRGGLAAEVDRGMRRDKLAASCMRAKGFTLAQKH